MRAGIWVATAMLASLSSTAFAADLPSRSAPPVYLPPPIPVFSWTGFYVGGQVGYEFDRDTVSAAGVFPAFSYNRSGLVGGAHAGYLIQFSEVVAGLEGDVNGASAKGTVLNPFLPMTSTSDIPVDGSVRGRIGVAVDRALFYATGGAAFASIRDTYVAAGGLAAVSSGRVGWTVGGGVEYAVTPEWALRAEYRYSDYGSFGELPGGVLAPRVNHDTDSRVQAGFSYKFGSILPPSVVARY